LILKELGVFQQRLLFSPEDIKVKVAEMARLIVSRHPDGNVLFVGLLKGSFIFLADLVRSVGMPCQVDFARISSYGSETVSSGKLNIVTDISMSVEGRDVILADDIVDSGLTLSEYRDALAARSPRRLEIAALINKTGRREKHVQIDYPGFEVEDGFLVGYGLDCDEQYRYLSGVYVLEETQ
jgi:hypoxanthine phosphoribosyltransferase